MAEEPVKLVVVRESHNVIRDIRRLAADSKNVFLTQHVREKMQKRGISRVQIDRCLEHGQQDGPPEDQGDGCWRARMRHRTAGVQINVVVDLEVTVQGDVIIVVTTFRS